MDEAESGWHGQRVLVTGGNGLLGTAVVELLLANGAEVVGLVRDRASAAAFARHHLAGRVRIIHGRTDDLFRIHSALAVNEIQSVFHFPPAEAAAFDRGVITILEAVRKFDPRVPVVFPRSGSAASLITSPVPLGVARFDELFGPDPEARGTVASAATALLEDRPLFAHDRGPRDYVHVQDAARGCLLLAEAVAKHPVAHVREAHFRSGWQFNDREISAVVREAFAGRTVLAPWQSVPSNPFEWSPSLNFGDALADTVSWYRESFRSRVRRERVRAAA